MEPAIHFGSVAFGTARTACGSWRGGTDWTTVRDLVSCPACLRKLAPGEGEPAARREPAIDPRDPRASTGRSQRSAVVTGRLWSWTW